jgi:hypothetical protein
MVGGLVGAELAVLVAVRCVLGPWLWWLTQHHQMHEVRSIRSIVLRQMLFVPGSRPTKDYISREYST